MGSQRQERFEVGAEPVVEVSLPAGSVRVEGGEEGTVVVDLRGPHVDRFVVERRGGVLVVGPERGGWVRWRPHDVVLAVPAGTHLRARLADAGCRVTTPLAALEVDTAAGDVEARDVGGELRVRSASGDVRVGRVTGAASLTSASGSMALEHSGGDLRVHSASGDVRVAHAAGPLMARTASGDVDVERYEGPDAECVTMSGDVRLRLVPGRLLDIDLHTMAGDIRSDFEVGADGGAGDSDAAGGEAGRVHVRSMSGDIAVLAASGSSTG